MVVLVHIFLQPEDGIQPLEALLYTIDKINRNESLLPGIRLGVLALDTCDSTTYAMEQSMLFMKSMHVLFISYFIRGGTFTYLVILRARRKDLRCDYF